MALKSQKGQAVALYAIMMPIMAVLILGIMDYMVTSARMMEAISAADLAAHAGAQEINLQPDGSLIGTSQGSEIAAMYFQRQAPGHTKLASTACGRYQGRPGCQVQVQVRSAGYLIPARWITVNAIGYMAYGVTEGDQ